MKSLVQHLTQYASYHRDKRNIATHFIGIPMIVAGLTVVLARPGALVAGLYLSPALIAVLLASVYYLVLDLSMGVALSAFLAACLMLGQWCAMQSTGTWLGWGLGLFLVGWVFQFVGHFWEGKKPAFVDDLMGLIIGPLFVVAEAAFLLGLRKPLQAQIEHTVGPTRIRQANSLENPLPGKQGNQHGG